MENQAESEFCPECGAAWIDDMDCWWQLGAICAWEWQDAELMALHFVTVASYNLQHPAQFTDQAIQGLRQCYIEYLDNGLSIAEIRQRVSHLAEGNVSVLRKENARRPVLRKWPMTIADVYIPDQPEGAAERVRAWAASIRSQFKVA